MDENPCIKCLKYAICVSRLEITCKDLREWLVKYGDKSQSFRIQTNNLISYEKWADREIAIIYQDLIRFKEIKSHHSTLVVRPETSSIEFL